MRIATTIFLTDRSVPAVRLARELEERGFDGLYLPEHTHIPVSRSTPAPMGGPLPSEYGRTLDPFVGLSAAAAVTHRLRLGTGVALVAQHDPIVLAKQVASLDFLSGGRFTLGVGFGWNVEEAADHGIDWPRRRELVRERMALMRALWAPEPTAYKGASCRVEASHAWPKPVSGGRPRILCGGAGGPCCSRTSPSTPTAGCRSAAADWRRACRVCAVWEDAGRDPESLRVVPYAVRPNAGKLAYYRDQGMEEVVLQLPSAGTADVLRTLDDYARYL